MTSPTCLAYLVALMIPEQITEMGWDTKLPLSLDDLVDALETAIGSHVFYDLGVDFLNMYVAFKRL
jgi:hypothetical protein